MRFALAGLGFAVALSTGAPLAVAEAAEVGEDDANLGEHAEHGKGHGEHHGATPPPPINWYQWHQGKDVLGGELHPAEDAMPPGLLFALLNFTVFMGLLVKFAGPKLSAYLRGRHDTIKNQLAESARLRQEALDKLDEFNRRISNVDAEVQKLMAEIRAEAEAEKESILAQARAQADATKREAERRIESEVARARLMLEREVITAAVAAAERVLRERTTSEDQSRLFDGFVDTLLTGGGSGGGGGSDDRPKRESKIDEEWS